MRIKDISGVCLFDKDKKNTEVRSNKVWTGLIITLFGVQISLHLRSYVLILKKF